LEHFAVGVGASLKKFLKLILSLHVETGRKQHATYLALGVSTSVINERVGGSVVAKGIQITVSVWFQGLRGLGGKALNPDKINVSIIRNNNFYLWTP
jgi:hypothetical protein